MLAHGEIRAIFLALDKKNGRNVAEYDKKTAEFAPPPSDMRLVVNEAALWLKNFIRKQVAPLDGEFPIKNIRPEYVTPLTTLLRKEPPPKGKP